MSIESILTPTQVEVLLCGGRPGRSELLRSCWPAVAVVQLLLSSGLEKPLVDSMK